MACLVSASYPNSSIRLTKAVAEEWSEIGKTSTAECVAANTNRPLFPITCGDIGGTTAKEVEDNLESYFDLARKWGCVLLLDEADVFLGERTKGDIVQNSLVSGTSSTYLWLF
jgi:hypothetical protein